MKKVKVYLERHEALRRALRTFVQVALGIVTTAVINALGVLRDVEWQSVIVLAVATGAAAVMNMNTQHPPDSTEYDETEPTIETVAGHNTLTVGTEVQPSQVSVKTR